MNRNYRRLRFWATMPAIAALLMPADAQAIFGCLQKRYDAAAAQYGANVCTPQGQQLVCNYVPQTCYRAQMVSVPVTTYRPVTSCDPCTGCQTTCMRPQVCYQQQVKYTPYSTYRLQYSLQQPTCAATATTYYAPVAAATYAAPAMGCSSCNSGATTTYYAPAVTTPTPVTYGANYAPVTTYAPAAAYAPVTSATPTYGGASTSRPTAGYAYPSTPAGIGGYNYAPSAFGPAAAASGYSTGAQITNPTSVQPTFAQPAYTAPSTTTPTYSGSTTTSNYAAPVYSAPAYSAPVYSAPASSAPSYSSPAGTAPAYSGPTTSTPVYGTPTLAAPTLSTPSQAAPSTIVMGGPMTPVPPSTFASPAATMPSSGVGTTTNPAPSLSIPANSGSSTAGYPAQPATNNPPAKSPYSSGVAPSTGVPTPVPSLHTPMPTPMPSSTTPPPVMPQPIPDYELNRGPRIGSPTSTPHLIDPEDKTAAAWPVRRAWGYREIPTHNVSLTTNTSDGEAAQTIVAAKFVEAVARPAVAGSTSAIAAEAARPTLGLPQVSQSAMVVESAPAAMPLRSHDNNGWGASSR